MFSSQSADLSFDSPCRTVAAVSADRVDNRFLVGSWAIRRNPDELYVCRFHSEVNELGLDAAIPHPTGPVQSIACCPTDVTLAATSTLRNDHATLWKLPRDIMEETGGVQYDAEDEPDMGEAPTAAMESVATLKSTSGKPITHIAWRQLESDGLSSPTASSSEGDVLTTDQVGNVQRWDIEFEQATEVRKCPSATDLELTCPPRVAWDPHANGDSAAVSGPKSMVRIFDWRSDQSIPIGTVEKFDAHPSFGVQDLDYNPNKPYVLCTSGTDGLIRFWDLRSAKRPTLTLRGGHSHWVSSVNYNPFHDQLLLSSSTDSFANLWRVSSISSAPLLPEESDPGAAADDRITFFEHTDSCYDCSWGAADAWIYVTVGYEGKAVLHHVPSKEKYKILL